MPGTFASFRPGRTSYGSDDAMLTWFQGRRKELCPYCFEHFLLKDAPFRCARCAPERDEVLRKRWGENRPLGPVLKPRGFGARALRCAGCGQESRDRLCPVCHSDLPASLGECRNYVFAVIGAKEAGKSHFIAVIINLIKNRLGPSLNLLLEAMNDDTIQRYKEDFFEPLFTDRRTLDGTVRARTDRKVQRPLLYSLTFTERGPFGGTAITSSVVLAFFDTAGEDLDSEDVMSTWNKYVYRSDGLILLVDPLQLPQVRAQLKDRVNLPGMNTEAAEILTRTTRLIQKGLKLGATDQIPIPIAVAFSKFDAVRPLIDDQSPLQASARHEGGFDALDFQAVQTEMMALLCAWGEQDLLNQVRGRYASSGFFGLSSLGCSPQGSEVPRVSPRRVEDPFLWLLAENGLIPRVRT